MLCSYCLCFFNQRTLSFMTLTGWFRCFSLVNWPHFTVTKPRLKEFRFVLKRYCCRRELRELKESEPEKFRGHLQIVPLCIKCKKKKKSVKQSKCFNGGQGSKLSARLPVWKCSFFYLMSPPFSRFWRCAPGTTTCNKMRAEFQKFAPKTLNESKLQYLKKLILKGSLELNETIYKQDFFFLRKKWNF